MSECELDEYGNVIRNTDTETSDADSIRAVLGDSTRSQLTRLGALYSDKDISSPITRTEQSFHEGLTASGRPKTKFTRLAALADEINNWEDDPSHPDYKHHRKTVYGNTDSPKKTTGAIKKTPAPLPPTNSYKSPKKPMISPKKPVVSPRRIISDLNSEANEKSLKWDSKVMSQLESQGFKRRESSTTKFVYDYNKTATDDDKYASNKKSRAPDVPDLNKPLSSHIEGREMPKGRPKVTAITNTGIVQERAVKFDKPPRRSIMKKDPTELPLKVKKKLSHFKFNLIIFSFV